MTSRYPLRNPPSGRPSVRRLSPTAVRNTGPLQHPRAAMGTGHASTEGTGLEPHFEPDASTSPAAGSAYPDTGTTEPEVGGNVVPEMEDDSSLTSAESDDDDRRDNTFVPPEVDTNTNRIDPISQTTNIPEYEGINPHNLHQEEVFTEACKNLTDEQRARIDRRMENLQFQADEQSGEPSQSKGKGVDPRNWGDIEFDEAEIEPQVQGEMIEEYNMYRDNPGNQFHQTVPDPSENEGYPSDMIEVDRKQSEIEDWELDTD
ncbi:hypothetical protein C0992_009662, partial [Termitomyces sp. T32_za158]